MKIKGIDKYIKLYNIENHLFGFIGPNAKERGFLLFDEFYKICMWKSARQKQRYIKNKDAVEQKTRQAFSEVDECRKVEILCQLDGVSIPTASALLTVVYPEKYGVIDIRCLEMLRKEGCGIGKHPSRNTWLKYLDIMREWARENQVTPREMDMALFAKHQEDLEKEDYRNLYRKIGSKMG